MKNLHFLTGTRAWAFLFWSLVFSRESTFWVTPKMYFEFVEIFKFLSCSAWYQTWQTYKHSEKSDTLRKYLRRGLIHRGSIFGGVWYTAEVSSEGSDTPWKYLRRGLIHHRSIFGGVWYTAEVFSEGSDTPQKYLQRGLIHRRSIWYSAEGSSEGFDTPRKYLRRGLIHRGSIFGGVWYTAEVSSEGSDTPQKFLRRGLIHRKSIFGGVWYTTEINSESIKLFSGVSGPASLFLTLQKHVKKFLRAWQPFKGTLFQN